MVKRTLSRLKTGAASFNEVSCCVIERLLFGLQRRFCLAFTKSASVPKWMPQAASFSFADTPLSEVIRRLSSLYRDSAWEWRQSGVLVVRGLGNGARNTHNK